ncbi:hypothetical protein [Rubrolithibacter danxiaensis]|uniref:hypothetical protein n=1 Tax=Rubrolithibacter danxiaensis TaxID=3390805 RepID=UPI003BF8AE15
MIRKDFLLAEIQKLAQILAKVLNLKNQGNVDEALQISHETLRDNFGIDTETLQKSSVSQFEEELRKKDFPPEKLDLLAQFLFESVYPFDTMPQTHSVLHKVLTIYNILEKEHHTLSMENYSRRTIIDNYLNTNQYE